MSRPTPSGKSTCKMRGEPVDARTEAYFRSVFGEDFVRATHEGDLYFVEDRSIGTIRVRFDPAAYQAFAADLVRRFGNRPTSPDRNREGP